jgi:hypothetical protein
MTLPKRTLLEADPNAPRAPTQAKYLKKTNDGKENEEIIEWYATLQTEELRELCRVRGKHVGGNRLQLIEYVYVFEALNLTSSVALTT